MEGGFEDEWGGKLHADIPMIHHHAIYDDETKLRIHLQLKGVFFLLPNL